MRCYHQFEWIISILYTLHFAIWGVSPIFGQSHLSSFIIIYPYMGLWGFPKSSGIPSRHHVFQYVSIPIGSMYGIHANIWGILRLNVTIYSIHGSYGICVNTKSWSYILDDASGYRHDLGKLHLSPSSSLWASLPLAWRKNWNCVS